MQKVKEEIIKILSKIITLNKKEIESMIEIPPEHTLGDFSFPCFTLSKFYKKNPIEISKEVSSKIILPRKSLIEKIEAKGPYINFFINYSKASQLLLKEIISKGQNYGKTKTKKQRIMIEYSSPNTNKPLHIGHLRNDSIGMSLSNILEFLDHKVIRTAIINDRGIHICKSMLAYQKWGNKTTPESTKTKSDHFVGNFYVLFEKELKINHELENEIHIMLKKWEDKNKEILRLWKKMNSWVLEGMKQTYKIFNSRFDFWTYESQIYNKAKPILSYGIKSNIFIKNEKGDLIAKLEPDLPDKVVLRADGTSIYITQDMVLAKIRFEKYKIGKLIYVVASEQNLHFQQLFKILQLLNYKWCKNCYHLSYGLVNLPSGRMKTREGTVIDADDLINEEKELAKKEILSRSKNIDKKELEDRAKKIALAAIKYYLLKIDPIKDVLFDPNKAISFEGDTGPYIQYALTRCYGIISKTKNWNQEYSNSNLQNEEKLLIRTLAEFHNIIKKASNDLKPSYICNYAFELATNFNNFYEKCNVLNIEDRKIRDFRITLVKSAKIVLENSLKLLNIEPIQRM